MHIDEEANACGSPVNSRTGVNDVWKLDIKIIHEYSYKRQLLTPETRMIPGIVW